MTPVVERKGDCPRKGLIMKVKNLLQEGIIVMPGAFNAITAKIIEACGFKAVYVSGAGLANGMAGYPDTGLLTMREVLDQARYIRDAVDIPVIADMDTGFGGPENTARAVKEFEMARIAGIHIEDQEFPKKCGHLPGKRLISPQEMSLKIKSAVRARTNPDFLIIARTDSRGVKGMKDAIKRAGVYLDAGADAIFPEGLETKTEFMTFAKEIKAPLLANMTEFGKTPYITVNEFEDMGYKMVIFPLTGFRVMLKSVMDAMIELKTSGTQKNLLDKMFTRKELYKLLKYEGY